MRNYAGTYKGICSYNLVYNFLIQLLLLQSPVFVVHFSNAFWQMNEAFPKGSSQNEIVPLLEEIFHLVYSKYRNVKTCFYSCSYHDQTFFTRVALVSFVQHSSCTRVVCVALVCLTRVALVSLVSDTRVVNQTRSIVHT